MQIISGKARGIRLEVPPGLEVRPTTGRARKALFDSLGSFDGTRIVDLFAGSGALGLESASRGAESVLLVEENPAHLRLLEQNIGKVRRTGVTARLEALRGNAADSRSFRAVLKEPDVIFADPPYPRSVEFFKSLLADPEFLRWGAGALLVWEIPDIRGTLGHFLNRPEFEESTVRKYGATQFLLATLPESPDEGKD